MIHTTLERLANRVDVAGQVAFTFGIAVALSIVLIFVADRRPPFEMLSYTATPARPGSVLLIDGKVRRDLDRECTVKYSRWMTDSMGRRFWEAPVQYTNSESLRVIDSQSPSQLRILLKIPDDAPVGFAKYNTSLDYTCNPVHYIWPIEITTVVQIEILPAFLED